MIAHKFHRLSNIILSTALLIFVAALLLLSVFLVRIKMLQNIQKLGMSLVQSYVVDEEMNISALQTNLILASQYVDEIVANGGDTDEVQHWLAGYFTKLSNTIGEGCVDFYAVIDGKIIAANPWDGDATYQYQNTDWYRQAMEAHGELVSSELYKDAVTEQSIFTLSKSLTHAENVIAMDVYIQNPAMHETTIGLPEDCSYYLCDGTGTLIFAVTQQQESVEAAQAHVDAIWPGIQDGSLADYDASFEDQNGALCGAYFQEMSNGWTVVMTIPIRSFLLGEGNAVIYIIAGIALLLFLILALMTVADYFRNRRMKIADDTAHMLGDSFYSIYRINVKNGTYQGLKIEKSIKDRLPPSGDYAVLLKTINSVVRPSTYRAFETSFSLESIRQRMEQGIADHGGDFQRLFGDTYRWVNIRTLYNPEIAPNEVILCFRDVDEEKRRELQHTILLQDALDTAQKSTKAKTEFFSRMSHDMRTPLNAILGCSDLALRDIENQNYASIQRFLQKISFAGKQLLDLINDILELSRTEAGKNYLEQKPLNLRDLLTKLTELFRDRIEAEQKYLDVVLDFRNDEVLGDQKKITQVINNLMSNALKYTNPGDSIRLEAKQFYFQNHSKYQIVVEDTGIGMTPTFLEHLFDPYTRETAFTSQTIIGTGLGMTIVKSLIQQMSGEISVESSLGKGSRFTVTLPLNAVHDLYVPEALELTTEESQFSWNGRKVLVAEDNELNREIVAAILEELGVEVLQAENGQKAVHSFLAQPVGEVDAILMDMHMPEMDGCAAAQAIRALDRTDAKEVPIIAVTANAFAEDIGQTTKAGMNDHVSKPIDSVILCQTIKRWILARESHEILVQ